MSLLENITLLLQANEEYLSNPKNRKFEDKMKKLRYYFLIDIEKSPEKLIVVKSYLENLMKTMKKEQNMNIEQYRFIKQLSISIEKLYLEGLKELTLNQKKTFFSRDFSDLLYSKEEKSM